MLVVGRITDGFQEIVETRGTPAVFGRTLEFAAHTDPIGNPRFGRQHFFNDDRMFLTVAKVVGIHSLRTDLAQNLEWSHHAFVADGG